MKRFTYIALMACIVALTACQEKEDKIVTPVAQAPQTALPAEEPARLDTAMKSSQESAAAVAQDSATSNTGMQEAMKAAEVPAKPAMQQETVKETAQNAEATVQKAETVAKSEPKAVEAAPVVAATEAAKAGDAAIGQTLAKKRCSMCHNFDSTKQKVGPGLKGVFGRAPLIEGVPFAKWDAAALDKWLTKPKAVKKNTKMAFPGFPNKADRDNVIAYLKTL